MKERLPKLLHLHMFRYGTLCSSPLCFCYLVKLQTRTPLSLWLPVNYCSKLPVWKYLLSLTNISFGVAKSPAECERFRHHENCFMQCNNKKYDSSIYTAKWNEISKLMNPVALLGKMKSHYKRVKQKYKQIRRACCSSQWYIACLSRSWGEERETAQCFRAFTPSGIVLHTPSGAEMPAKARIWKETHQYIYFSNTFQK